MLKSVCIEKWHAGQNADPLLKRNRDSNLSFWMQLLDEKDRDRILGPHKKVQQWIESTRNATRPHFDEVHTILYKLKTRLSEQQSNQADGVMQSRIRTPLSSKMWTNNHASNVPVTTYMCVCVCVGCKYHCIRFETSKMKFMSVLRPLNLSKLGR